MPLICGWYFWFSNKLDDHLRLVSDVMTALHDAETTLKLNNCKCFPDTVNHLGHAIRAGRLMIEHARLHSLIKAKECRTKVKLCSFFGLVNVYQRFIPNFSDIATPLNALPRRQEPTNLETRTREHTKFFQLLITAVSTEPILAFCQKKLPYSVDTDTSDYHVGCALFQTAPDDECRPLGYWSRTVNFHERNYSVLEKDCLAVFWAIRALRLYLVDISLIMYVD